MLLEELEGHLAKLPEEKELEDLRGSARQFIRDVRESGASEAMAEAEAGLAEFAGTRGHAGAKSSALRSLLRASPLPSLSPDWRGRESAADH